MADISQINTGNITYDIKDAIARIQVSIMPEASSTYNGKLYQYIGTTNESYTNGYFYKCIYNNGSYSWINIPVTETYIEWSGTQAEYDEQEESIPEGAIVIISDGQVPVSNRHIIVNASNISMTDRSKLKIIGANITDDNVNDQTIVDITGKADKVSGATNGNFAGLDGNGNLTDSGSNASDFIGQVSTMPTASSTLEGKVVQFIGTTGTYTHGYFYECEETSTDVYEWVNVSVNAGGGGGGGHTILDGLGSAMTSRSKLQLEGGAVKDDPTNDKTVFTVAKELTQAAYDALSSQEKNNGTTYYITDAPSSYTGVPQSMIGDAWVTSHAYAVGDYCIDRNTLYKCKTAHTSSASYRPPYASYWDAVSVASQLSGTETWEELTGTFTSVGNGWYSLTDNKIGKATKICFDNTVFAANTIIEPVGVYRSNVGIDNGYQKLFPYVYTNSGTLCTMIVRFLWDKNSNKALVRIVQITGDAGWTESSFMSDMKVFVCLK